MGRPLWQLLILGTQQDKVEEFSCEECLSVLDYYLDRIMAGGDMRQLEVPIGRHLSHCSDCRQELERKFEQWERFSEDPDAEETNHK